MEPILEEASLVPCPVWAAPARVRELARTLQALDKLGAHRVLRSVRDAADRDIGEGRGLRSWCFDRSTEKDAGRLIASRLAAQPFIDGPEGLFTAAEGERAVDARLGGIPVLGAGLAALTDGLLVILVSDARPGAEQLTVALTFLDEAGERTESVKVHAFARPSDVESQRASLLERLDRSVKDGKSLAGRIGELFPRLLLGERARNQIAALGGTEPVFRQLVRHLRALDAGALHWVQGRPFEPVAVTFSVESKATLEDGALGPMRDFPAPEGFEAERWSLHTKLTGGAGARLYFRAVRTADRSVVLVGYFGDHLPTVKHRT